MGYRLAEAMGKYADYSGPSVIMKGSLQPVVDRPKKYTYIVGDRGCR